MAFISTDCAMITPSTLPGALDLGQEVLPQRGRLPGVWGGSLWIQLVRPAGTPAPGTGRASCRRN